MFDSEDVPTQPGLSSEHTQISIRLPEAEHHGTERHGAELHELTEDDQPLTNVMSVSLPISANEAFDLFCDSGRVHEWMTVVRSSQVIARGSIGRPQQTAFIAQLERSSLGYTMHYEYDDETLTIRWCNGPANTTRISGSAHFTRLKPDSCMMHYELNMDSDTTLPSWGDAMFNAHPASSVLCDFREFVARTKG